jgi:hypothetical protein
MQDQWLGGYRLIRRLGTGGAGTVWLAEDGGGVRVALKLLHPALADTEQARTRLTREATTVNRVRSSGVAHVVDVETDATQPFVVTEFIEGPTLASRLASGPLSAREVAALAEALRRILEAVHAAGIVHRDVKPSNVILHPTGPVLIDFGIAQEQGDDRLTATGMVSGTAGFAAPELLRGGLPSQATDWWAWAATLLDAATARPPFGPGQPAAIAVRVLEGRPDVEGLPGPVAAALTRALAVDPAGRAGPDRLCALLEDPAAWNGAPVADPGATQVMEASDDPAGLPGEVEEETRALTSPTRTMPLQQAPAWQERQWPPSPMPGTGPAAAFPSSWAPPEAGVLPVPYLRRRPRRVPVVGLVLLAALAAPPVLAASRGTAATLLALGVLAALGEGFSWRERRRERAGGPRRSDTAMALAAAPLHVLRALAQLVLGLAVGSGAAAAVWLGARPSLANPPPLAWPLEALFRASANYDPGARILDPVLQPLAWGLVLLVLAVAWAMPTSTGLRDGAGLVVGTLLGPLWARIAFCAIIVAVLAGTWLITTGGL